MNIVEMEGLVCAECSEDLLFGNEITTRLAGVDEDGVVVSEIVCMKCGFGDGSL